MLCLEGAGYARDLDDRPFAREVISACNTWLADQVDGHQDRLMPATALDLTDLDLAVTELARMRARGSRSLLLASVPVPFDRHPNLTLVFAEFGVHWFAGTVEHMEARGPAVPETAVYMGAYPYELTPAQFVQRNIRVTPLPRHHQSAIRTLERYPDCVIFSSDYAHNESNPEPTAHYDALLADVDRAVVDRFLGGNIADCYARMGDPLAVASG